MLYQQEEDAVDVYRELAAYPTVVAARIVNAESPGHVKYVGNFLASWLFVSQASRKERTKRVSVCLDTVCSQICCFVPTRMFQRALQLILRYSDFWPPTLVVLFIYLFFYYFLNEKLFCGVSSTENLQKFVLTITGFVPNGASGIWSGWRR